MSWIKVIDKEEADGQLKEIYNSIAQSRKQVANILTVSSLNAVFLKTHFELYKTLMFSQSLLSRRQREMIAVVVSATNNCHY